MNRLEEARLFADARRRHHADGTADDRRLVRQDVAEKIARDDDVELRRTHGKLHGAVVDIKIRKLDIREVLRDLSHRAPPEARGREHIRLVNARDMAAAQLRRLERELCDAFDFRYGIVFEIPCPLVAVLDFRFALLAEVDAADQLAHDDKVSALDKLGLQRRILDERVSDLHGTQIRVKAETLPKTQNRLFRAQSRLYRVPLIAADSAEEHAVRRLRGGERRLRQRRATLVVSRAARIMLLIGERQMELFRRLLEHGDGCIRDFSANAVARYHHDLLCHQSAPFSLM